MTVKRVPVVCHGHSRPIVEVNYSSITTDGFFLASASKDGQPMLRFGHNGDWYGTFLGHKGAVWSCVLNEPALLAATGSADFSARLWNACDGNQIHEFSHKHIVRSVNFSQDSTKLATGGHEKIIRVFDVNKPDSEPLQFPSATAVIRSLNWIQDDKLLLCALGDQAGIRIYDTRSQEMVKTLSTKSPVTSIEVSFDKKYLTATEGKCVKIFDTSRLEVIKDFNVPTSVESASYCASAKKVVAGGDDMWVHVYDFDTGQELDCNKGHHGPIHTVRFAPTGDSYASGSEDGTIRIWFCDLPDGESAQDETSVGS